ncbi:MAG: hypothetical protein IJ048_09130 [Clostridia bacterium]|nr:hypothetical protein [Clostridia bacterium]
MKKILFTLFAILLCMGAVCHASKAESAELIFSSFDARYTVAVDDALNVTLSHTRAIARFDLHRNGDVAYDSYEIVTLQGEYQVSVNGKDFQKLDASVVDALYQVFEAYDLAQWDGFNEAREGVLDGEGFWLDITLTDGTSVHAHGSNAFPERYFEAVGEMQEILDGIGKTPAVTMGGILNFFASLRPGKREWTVGTDIGFDDITEFYYTYDASTDPPHYQRYRFYRENGATLFYHETREGGGWPQTEADITVSGTVTLSEEQTLYFHACLEGGTVRGREESLDDGDAGPWTYLYWNGDQGSYQEFSFASWEKRIEFEDFCAALRDSEP